MKKLLTLLSASLAALGSISQATILLEENFDSGYADGTELPFVGTVGDNTWYKSKGVLVATYNVFLVANDGAIDYINDFEAVGTSTQEVAGFYNATTAAGLREVYYCVDLTLDNVPASSEYLIALALADGLGGINSGLRARVYVEAATGNIGLGLLSSPTEYTDTALTPGTTYHVVVRFDNLGGGEMPYDNTCSIWVDPTPADEDTPLYTTVAGAASIGGLNFNKAFASKGFTATMDNLIIGSAWSDVVAGAVAPRTTWGGHTIDENGWVDTGDYLGFLYVGEEASDFVYSTSLTTWLYLPEASYTASLTGVGTWVYSFK